MAQQGRLPEEENKKQDQSQEQAKQSARDERANKGDENRTNRTESEQKPRERVQRVGTEDKDGVYKHEGVGAVSREDMKVHAAVAKENQKSREQGEKESLDTSPEARDKMLEMGAKNKRDSGNYSSAEMGDEIAKQLDEQPLRRVVDQSNQAEMHGHSASAPVVEYGFTTKLVKKMPESDVKVRVTGGFGQLYDEWYKKLSSSEQEAFGYDPEAGIIAFRKHLTTYDENELRGKLITLREENKK